MATTVRRSGRRNTDDASVHTLAPGISVSKVVDFDGDGSFNDSEQGYAGTDADWRIVVTNSGVVPIAAVSEKEPVDLVLLGYGAFLGARSQEIKIDPVRGRQNAPFKLHFTIELKDNPCVVLRRPMTYFRKDGESVRRTRLTR